MLNAGMKYVRHAWWLTVFPGAGIFLALLSINLIGDAISDAIAGTTIMPTQKYGKIMPKPAHYLFENATVFTADPTHP